MFGWVKSALRLAASAVALLTVKNKIGLLEGLPALLGQLLPAVDNAIKYQGLDTKEKFDSWLLTVDAMTGTDAGAVDIVPSLPAEIEEQLFDHLVEAARIYGYNKIGVPGYVVA